MKSAGRSHSLFSQIGLTRMAGKYLGIEVEDRFLKIVIMNKGKVTRTILEVMPDNMVIGGKIVAFHALAEYLREVIRNNKIRVRNTAFAVPSESYYIRRVRLPRMTHRQLLINIPYEFHDYLQEEADQYVYDYAVLSSDEQELELLIAAFSKEQIAQYKAMCKRAGLTLVKLVPDVLALQQVVLPPEEPAERRKRLAGEEKKRAAQQREEQRETQKRQRELEKEKRRGKLSVEELSRRAAAEAQASGISVSENPLQQGAAEGMPYGAGNVADAATLRTEQGQQTDLSAAGTSKDYAVLCMGYSRMQLHFFSGGAYEITRNLSASEKALCEAIAAEKGVDVHIAQVMLDANQNGVAESELVTDQIQTMATELMRVMNFYNYNNPRNSIDCIYYCGRAMHPVFVEHIQETVDLPVRPLTELLPEGTNLQKNPEEDNLLLMMQGYGAVLE